MNNIAIIGAGISGLSLAQILKNEFHITIYEADSAPGGIAKVQNIDGIPFHLTGGHCFNSHNQEVLDFVFQKILPKENWRCVERDAKILINSNLIRYPIELSIKDIFRYDKLLAIKCIIDFLLANRTGVEVKNFRDWLVRSFGKTLSELYFIPYNKKIWGKDPKDIELTWLSGKLPQRNIPDFLKSFFSIKEKKMVHSTFYYPKLGDNALVRSLAFGLNIRLNHQVGKIEAHKNGWLVDDQYYDKVVYTGPLDELPKIKEISPQLLKNFSELEYNQVTTTLWKAIPQDYLWCYDPSLDTIFHRYIHIGKFLETPINGYMIAEAHGHVPKEEITMAGKKIPFLLELVDIHHSKHAYVVFKENTKKLVGEIYSQVNTNSFYLLGRFGQWTYYNMDDCMSEALKLAKQIRHT